MPAVPLSLLSLGCAFGLPVSQPSSTALQALKIAQRRLPSQVRENLLTISSARTDASLRPVAWRFVFSDPRIRKHWRGVVVAAGASSEHPEVIKAFRFAQKINPTPVSMFPLGLIALDSDQALRKVQRVIHLRGFVSASYQLSAASREDTPVWQLAFYSSSSLHPSRSFQVPAQGEIIDTSETKLQWN